MSPEQPTCQNDALRGKQSEVLSGEVRLIERAINNNIGLNDLICSQLFRPQGHIDNPKNREDSILKTQSGQQELLQ